jgi:hypothetical protein
MATKKDPTDGLDLRDEAKCKAAIQTLLMSRQGFNTWFKKAIKERGFCVKCMKKRHEGKDKCEAEDHVCKKCDKKNHFEKCCAFPKAKQD